LHEYNFLNIQYSGPQMNPQMNELRDSHFAQRYSVYYELKAIMCVFVW